MKKILNACIILFSFLLISCEKEELNKLTQEDFDNQVEALIGKTQTAPKLDEVQETEWKCNSWQVLFYSNGEKIGEWDTFGKTIKDSEKAQVYRFMDGKFANLLLNAAEQKSTQTSNSYNFQWDEKGDINVNGIPMKVRREDNQLLIYYNVNDVAKIGELFNVSVDNSYGQSLADETQLIGVGVIKLAKNQATAQENSLSNQEIVEKFMAKKTLFGGVYLAMRKQSGMTFLFENGNKAAVIAKLSAEQQVEIAPNRAQVLVDALLFGSTFEVLSTQVIVHRIAFHEGSNSVFRVNAITNNQQAVSFLYNIAKDEQSWIVAPETVEGINLSSFDLIDKFLNRKEISGQVFNRLLTTNESFKYILNGGSDNKSYAVSLTNNQIDIANITPELARNLFQAFLSKQAYTFTDVAVTISKIEHEDGSGKAFLVYGTTENQENVKFFINIETGKKHWLIAPEASANEMNSVDLVTKFAAREKIFNQTFNSIKTTSDAYTFVLFGGQDQQEHNVIIANQQIDLANVSQQNNRDLFNAFLKKTTYKFQGENIIIDRIDHESGGGNSFLVTGNTSNQEEVTFFFNTTTGKSHWTDAPQNTSNQMNSYDLVNKFAARENIFDQVFNSIKPTSDAYTFVLFAGQDQQEHKVVIANQQIDLANVSNQNNRALFTAFLNKTPYAFKGVNVNIARIDHEDGGGNSFLVTGTTPNQEEVTFYFNTVSGKMHWTDAPQAAANQMSSYDLVNKFAARENIFDQVFNSIKPTSDAYTFVLFAGQDQQEHQVIIANQQIDLANVSNQNNRALFTAFLNKTAYAFKGVNVNIARIDHEDGGGNSFLVTGTTPNQEEVTFYFNTVSGKMHWTDAPQTAANQMSAVDLVAKFAARENIFGQVFNDIKITSDAYSFVLFSGNDQQEHQVVIANQQFDLANVSLENNRELFSAFLTKTAYTFKGMAVNINRISHEDGGGNSFIISGLNNNQENVKFYFNTETGKSHWL